MGSGNVKLCVRTVLVIDRETALSGCEEEPEIDICSAAPGDGVLAPARCSSALSGLVLVPRPDAMRACPCSEAADTGLLVNVAQLTALLLFGPPGVVCGHPNQGLCALFFSRAPGTGSCSGSAGPKGVSQ